MREDEYAGSMLVDRQMVDRPAWENTTLKRPNVDQIYERLEQLQKNLDQTFDYLQNRADRIFGCAGEDIRKAPAHDECELSILDVLSSCERFVAAVQAQANRF